MAGTIVLFGSIAKEDGAHRLASIFGWFIRSVATLDELRVFAARRPLAAVLFRPSEIHDSLPRALTLVHQAAPVARLVVCRTFAGKESFEQLTAMGAFYLLRVPFADHELRQCFGFLHSAGQREQDHRAEDTQQAAGKSNQSASPMRGNSKAATSAA